jgi:hypothetical protein
MPPHLVRGTDAHALLAEPGFLNDWRRLAGRCPWATAFQTPHYAPAWYDVHRRRFEPVLVLGRGGAGGLTGLLTPARCRGDDGLVVAGGRQAEYQAWLCEPDLAAEFPRAVLTFRYLPSGTPLRWLGDPEVGPTTRLDCHRRPLVRLDREQGAATSLNNRKTRYRLKQFEKLGKLELSRIGDPAEFAAILDTVISYYDLRQEAAHGLAPFRDDGLKKELVLARMRDGMGRLHATASGSDGGASCASTRSRSPAPRISRRPRFSVATAWRIFSGTSPPSRLGRDRRSSRRPWPGSRRGTTLSRSWKEASCCMPCISRQAKLGKKTWGGLVGIGGYPSRRCTGRCVSPRASGTARISASRRTSKSRWTRIRFTRR